MLRRKVENIELCKESFSIAQLMITLLFSTYFLTIETIELSLAIYVLNEDKLEMYREYILFKRQAPIWKWWQTFSMLILLLSIITTVRDFIQTLTRKATFQRNLLDILKTIQMFSVLYISFQCLIPLQKKLIESKSMNDIRELISFKKIVFLLNIFGWFIPIFRYQDWKNDKQIHQKKKTQ